MAALRAPCCRWSSQPTDCDSATPISTSRLSPCVHCGLRTGPRKPLWKSRVLSTEAIHAVQALKFAKSTSKLGQVLHTRIRRLLKADAVAALAELQRQNEWDIALKVFEFMRMEMLYQPDASLYADMILLVGKNKMVRVAEELFVEMEREGLEHNARVYTEMIGAYFQVGMVEKAMEMYGVMKKSGCMPDKLAFAILINGLEKAREEELACSLKKEFRKYLDDLAI